MKGKENMEKERAINVARDQLFKHHNMVSGCWSIDPQRFVDENRDLLKGLAYPDEIEQSGYEMAIEREFSEEFYADVFRLDKQIKEAGLEFVDGSDLDKLRQHLEEQGDKAYYDHCMLVADMYAWKIIHLELTGEEYMS